MNTIGSVRKFWKKNNARRGSVFVGRFIFLQRFGLFLQTENEMIYSVMRLRQTKAQSRSRGMSRDQRLPALASVKAIPAEHEDIEN